MAQTGFTPILVYASGTATNVPLAANLTSTASGAELALNYADGKLYYKNGSGVVTLLASSAGAAGDVVGPASATDNALARFDLTTGKLIQNSVGVLSDAGVLTGLTGLTSSGNVTLSALTSTRVPYASTGGLLVDSANLTFDGTILTAGGLAGPFNGTVGATTANTGAFTTVTASTAIGTASGGTGLGGATPFTANGVVYASSTSALATGSALVFDGTSLGVGGVPTIQGELNVFKTGAAPTLYVQGDTGNSTTQGIIRIGGASGRAASIQGFREGSSNAQALRFYSYNSADQLSYEITGAGTSIWSVGGSEQMRLTSSGLEIKQSQLIGYSSYAGIGTNGLAVAGNVGVGTASPGARLEVFDTSAAAATSLVQLTGQNNFEFNIQSVTTTNSTVGARYNFAINSSNGEFSWTNSGGERARITSGGELLVGLTSATGVALLQVSGPIRTIGYTVATLPAGTVGMRTYVTDALAPSFGVAVAGSGAVTIPVFYDGANWIVA
jgi:hypothetical protein